MKRTLFVLTLSVLTATLIACGGGGESREAPARDAIAVNTAQATVADVTDRLEAGGIVAANETALLSSRIVAPILDVRVRAGDRVRKGDVLVTLDARDAADHARQATAAAVAAEQALAQARTARAAAEADRRLAAAWQARINALHAKNSATAQERDEAEARLESATARAAGAQAGIDLAEANVTAARAASGAATTTESFSIIRAPFDALVTERLIDPGNLAAPGTPLVRVDSTTQRRVEVTVDEARAAFIQVGDRVDVLIERSSERDEELPLEGAVAEVARAIDAGQRAFTVKVTLPASEAARSGTFARVRFRGASRRVLLIPASAIRRQGQVASVFVVEEGMARMRLVQTGDTEREGVVVLAGVDAGETVVTSPPPQLVDGHPVRTSGPPPQTGERR